MITFEPKNIQESVDKRISRYRRALGLTQGQMAELLGMKFSTYAQKERCGNIECNFLFEVANIFGIDPVILFIGENEWTPVSPEFNLSVQEQNFIRILRNMKPKQRDLAFEVVYNLSKSK